MLEQNKLEKFRVLEEKKKLWDGLPHIYAHKHYPWSREYFESRNKMCLVCSGNQVGKSTLQIKRLIHWATSPELWPELWLKRPTQFWYLYPSKDVCTLEFETKWIYILPRGEFKDHPQYGGKEYYDTKKIH